MNRSYRDTLPPHFREPLRIQRATEPGVQLWPMERRPSLAPEKHLRWPGVAMIAAQVVFWPVVIVLALVIGGGW